jgi:hypothetical protein
MSEFGTIPNQSRPSRTRTKALPFLIGQLGASALLLVAAHWSGSVALHVFLLLAMTGIGIWLAIIVLRIWKREIQNGWPIFPWMLCLLALALAYQILDGADVYIHEIYGGNMVPPAISEGMNFSVQTVTTVGYGNWPLSNSTIDYNRLLELRDYSVGLMILGASLFTVVFGMTTTWLMQM